MTVFGVACSLARAIIWADSELSYRGMPSGECDKIVVNSLGIVGVGSGRDAALRLIDAHVAAAISLDRLLETLPPALRSAPWRFPGGDRVRGDYLIVAFDRRVRRVIAVVHEAPYFEPRAVRCFASPEGEGRAAPYAETADDCISVAQGQLAVLQRQLPEAIGGTLTMATITAEGVDKRPIFDFRRSCMLRAA